jgi:branched-chain amino acid transport system substrate-binding protein
LAEFVRRFRASAGVEPDYPAAQAYAAGVLTAAAIRTAGSLEAARVRAAFADLRISTLFGDFAIDRDSGRQLGHKMVLVQWHGGRKVVIQPAPDLRTGELEFPSGWRLLLGSLRALRLRRKDGRENEVDEES